MDAKEYLRNLKRMCESYGEWCENCPACELSCTIQTEHPDELITIVEKWSKEHPLPTNRMKFNEVFGMDLIIMDKGFRPLGVMPALKYIIDWLNEEYKDPKEYTDKVTE